MKQFEFTSQEEAEATLGDSFVDGFYTGFGYVAFAEEENRKLNNYTDEELAMMEAAATFQETGGAVKRQTKRYIVYAEANPGVYIYVGKGASTYNQSQATKFTKKSAEAKAKAITARSNMQWRILQV